MTHPRTHLLTGAGSGIGAELAVLLRGRGDALVLLARSAARAEELVAAHPGSATLVADLADPAGLERALADADLPDRLDSVVHAAGVVELGPVADLGLDAWQQQLDVNLTAPFLLTRALLPALRAARGQVEHVQDRLGHGLGTDPLRLVVRLALLLVHPLLHRGGHPAGIDAAHPDAVVLLLLAQSVGERTETELRGAVRRPGGVDPQPGAGVDEHDRASRGPQGGQCQSRQLGGSEEVDVELLAPRLG